jgi:lysozyme
MVLVDMIFNLGLTRFLLFKNLNAALAAGDYLRAAHEMLDSRWYRQVGRRARKLRHIMLTGEWQDG